MQAVSNSPTRTARSWAALVKAMQHLPLHLETLTPTVREKLQQSSLAAMVAFKRQPQLLLTLQPQRRMTFLLGLVVALPFQA